MGSLVRRYNKPCRIALLAASGCLALPAFSSPAAPQSIVVSPPPEQLTPGVWSGEPAGADNIVPAQDPRLEIPDYHGSIELYEQAIVAIEDEHGVYDAGLVQQVMGLGLAQQTQGQDQGSIGSFKRALHLIRINDGLYSLSQAPILRHLIASYEAENDWANANDSQAYLYRLQRRHYGYSDPRLLQPIISMVDWHMNAFDRGSSADPGIHLLQARALNEQAIKIIEENYSGDDVRLSEALYRQALTNYQLAVLQANNSMGGLTPAGRQAEVTFSESDVQKTVFSLNPYSEGKRALSRRADLVEANPEIPSQSKLRAMIQLGDWYFMFNKRDSAMKTYRRAQDLFASDDAAREELQKYFNKPHVLSFYKATQKRVPETDTTGYVDAVFNITSTGRAQGIQIIDSSPPDVMDSRVQRSIRATRYRPRFVEGRPVTTEGVSYRHVFEVEPEPSR